MKHNQFNNHNNKNTNTPRGYFCITGQHSIMAAIHNIDRKNLILHCPRQFYLDNNISELKINCVLGGELALYARELFIESSLDEILENNRIILLDGLEDPRNIGSIIRTAAILNFNVIIRESKGCPINETVVKCSSGGVDFTKIGYIRNLSENLNKIKDEGFWIVSLSEKGESKIDLNKYKKLLIVIGSEGNGISKNVMNQSDILYCLHHSNDFSTYNASVAAAIAMYTTKI